MGMEKRDLSWTMKGVKPGGLGGHPAVSHRQAMLEMGRGRRMDT